MELDEDGRSRPSRTSSKLEPRDGHKVQRRSEMSDELRKDEEPEVEGHRFPPTVGASDESSDVEAHRFPPTVGASDEPSDVEAHGRRGADDDDDVEGHVMHVG